MNVPDKIYLQVLDGDGEAPDEVTWCADRIYDTDVEYVRKPWNPCLDCPVKLTDEVCSWRGCGYWPPP